MTFDTESTLFLLTVTPIIDTRSASVIIPAALMVDWLYVIAAEFQAVAFKSTFV
jgi:hypothetical protein